MFVCNANRKEKFILKKFEKYSAYLYRPVGLAGLDRTEKVRLTETEQLWLLVWSILSLMCLAKTTPLWLLCLVS